MVVREGSGGRSWKLKETRSGKGREGGGRPGRDEDGGGGQAEYARVVFSGYGGWWGVS